MRPSQINFLTHIQEELGFILHYSQGITYDEFIKHPLLPKAFIRSFEVVGEACKNVAEDVRLNNPKFDWRGFAGMRDKLIHQYWGVDYFLMWDAIQNELPTNKEWIDIIIEQEAGKAG